ncbi:MAG: flippase activity-associated protein Agl23 [Chthoniobacteraceae bacterium]
MSDTSSSPATPKPFPWAKATQWAIVALALVLRLLWLRLKPPHFDEGVNGWFVDQMRLHGYYSYDPTNYHGPFHFYVLFLFQTLLGRDILSLRLPLVLINTATVWLIFQFRRFLPWRACAWAALAFAVSPGMMFYSRYAIHESWLVFGMILGLWGAAELWTRGSVRGLWTAALGATLMILNKETHIIHFAAFALAIPTLALLERFAPSAADGIPARPAARQWSRKMLLDAVIGCLFLLVFFYSGGFLDPAPWKKVAGNFFTAFMAWGHTGVKDEGHCKAWYYWIQLIVRYEWPVLLGLLWSVRALWPGMNRLARFTAVYGCGVLVGYSLVPYKTPWCIVSLIWPFFFVFGAAVDEALSRSWGARWSTSLAGAGVVAGSFAVSADLNYRHPTVEPGTIAELNLCPESVKLPHWSLKVLSLPSYVYVQTDNDYFKLMKPLKQLAAADPQALHLPIHILLSSYHPLPWALGDFTDVGYYDKEAPEETDAAVIVAESDQIAKLEAGLKKAYFIVPFQLRDAMDGGRLYFSAAHFAHVFPGRTPEFTPHPQAAPVDAAATPAVPAGSAQ